MSALPDPFARLARAGAAAALLLIGGVATAEAQQAPVWPKGIDLPGGATVVMPTPGEPKNEPAAAPGANTTVIPRTGGETKAPINPSQAQVKLVALLTADGQRIDQGVVWRIYEAPPERDGKSRLIATHRDASPLLKLHPGDYLVNAAFGRAHLTRKISVAAGALSTEQFVLNAGGLRLTALIGSTPAPPNSVSYSIYSDERDQFGNRSTIMTGAKPGLIVRLNAGIYNVVSTYGDANAAVRTDITVEAGKLTEATLSHAAAKVTLKLVTRSGGEALPDTHWSVQTPQGELVKESVGALPTHILAPGSYTVLAKNGGRTFRRDFTVQHGEIAQVEVLME